MYGNLFRTFQPIPLMDLRKVEDIAGAELAIARKVGFGD